MITLSNVEPIVCWPEDVVQINLTIIPDVHQQAPSSVTIRRWIHDSYVRQICGDLHTVNINILIDWGMGSWFG